MKNFFKNKLNIALSVVLLILIGVGVFLGFKFFEKPPVKAIDYSNMFEDEIVAWSIENEVQDLFEFEHEYDETIESGKVIYQSIKEGEAIEDTILIIISDGPDQTDMIEIPVAQLVKQDETELWFNENGFSNVKYELDDTSDKDDGTVLSITPSKAKKDDEVIVKIASKKTIDVPDFSFMSDKEIENWSKDNIVKISYVKEASKQAKGAFLKQSVKAGEKVAAGSTITITISSGETKTESKVAKIPGTYLGIEEDKFLANLKSLGFNSTKKDETTYFSVNSKKGTIFSYDDGELVTTTVIKYAISEGKYEFNASEYNDKSKTDVEALIKKYNNRNAHITLKTNVTDTKEHKNGYLYDCSSSFATPNTTITCKLANNDEKEEKPTSTKAYIDPYKYLGKSESTFTNDLKDLGFTNVVKEPDIYSSKRSKGTICYYLPDGEQKLDTKITYKLSLGSYASVFNASEYNGKTKDQANNVIKSHNDKEAGISLSTVSTKTKDHAVGTLYDCSLSGSTVSCKLAAADDTPVETKVKVPSFTSNPCKGTTSSCSLTDPKLNYSVSFENSSSVEEGKVISLNPAAGTSVNENSTVNVVVSKGAKTAYIDSASAYRTESLKYSSVDDTKAYLNGILGDFDLSYNTDTSFDYDIGTIISISVNGNSKYTPDYYPVSTEIVITISSGKKS